MNFNQNNQNITNGLSTCFQYFQGGYCVRKLTEFILSTLLIITTIIIIILYSYKYRLDKKFWLLSILTLISISLIANIIFCFNNHTYWIYAVQTYTYQLYYLFIVGYICRAYLLKSRSNQLYNEVSIRGDGLRMVNNKQKQKVIFFIIFITLCIIYTGIFILSIFKQIESEKVDDSNPKVNYCQEVYQIIFDVFCALLSIIVLIILYKNHKEQMSKIQQYGILLIKNKPKGSLLSQSNNNIIQKNRIRNPLNKLWIWILINIFCYIFGLINSGLLLHATPSQCLIIKQDVDSSNYLQLFFNIVSMYVGYIGTLWYIILVKIVGQTAVVDRTIIFSQQVKVQGNIQLFQSSIEQNIFIL